MSDRLTDANVRERCANLNRRMERRGANVRYEVSRRYDYMALDRMIGPNFLDQQDVVRTGTRGEIAEFLHAMMVALDDEDLYRARPSEASPDIETATIILRYVPTIDDRPDIAPDVARQLWRDELDREAERLAERHGCEVDIHFVDMTTA